MKAQRSTIHVRPVRVGGAQRSYRRGNVLAEFVLFLPFLFFILAMIFHFGVSNLRKQRTIVAARYASEIRLDIYHDLTDVDAVEDRFDASDLSAEDGPVVYRQRDVMREELQRWCLPKLEVEDIGFTPFTAEDGLDRLNQTVMILDADESEILKYTDSFWQRELEMWNDHSDDLIVRYHSYAHGVRVSAAYRPDGPYYEQLQGRIFSSFHREYDSWALPWPDMWIEVFESADELTRLRDEFITLSRFPQMESTGHQFVDWFRR